MRPDRGALRHVSVQELPVPRVAVDVIPCPGPLVIDGAPFTSASASALNGPNHTGAVGRSKVRLHRFETVSSRIPLHRDELPVVAAGIGDSTGRPCAAGSQTCASGDQ